MEFAGSLDKQATVTVGGNSATVNHTTTNFVGYASVTNGTNVVPIVATDYNNNARTNKYQLVVTNNGVAKTITFDLNGNETNVVTATSTNTYQWDAANRLMSVTGPTNQSLFTYDGLGRRVQIIEQTNGVAYATNKFVWCGQELCEQRDLTGTNVTKRFFGGGEQMSGTNYFFTRDHLGSVREMTDGTGAIKARYDYDPYGRQTKISGTMDADFGYAGMYYHAASGLNLTLYRTYDSDLGRWPNHDPIGEVGGINLYGYVGNNPVNRIDPFGLDLLVITASGIIPHQYLFGLNADGTFWYTDFRPKEGGLNRVYGPSDIGYGPLHPNDLNDPYKSIVIYPCDQKTTDRVRDMAKQRYYDPNKPKFRCLGNNCQNYVSDLMKDAIPSQPISNVNRNSWSYVSVPPGFRYP